MARSCHGWWEPIAGSCHQNVWLPSQTVPVSRNAGSVPRALPGTAFAVSAVPALRRPQQQPACLPAMRSAHAMCTVQEFGLEDDAQKFAAEMQRAERMAAAAAAATAVGSIPSAAPSPARSRITAPSQRPSTGATLAALAGPGLASPFRQQAAQQQQLHAAARGLSGGLPAASALPSTRRASGALDLQITGGRPPTAAHPIDRP